MNLTSGSPYPRGAHYSGKGTNFALFSDNATGVILCLFSDDGKTETHRIRLKECTNSVWHGFLEKVKPGQRYGYRVEGPWAPAEGLRFNSHKLLIDPYARKLQGEVIWNPAVYGYKLTPDKDADLIISKSNSSPYVPKAIVVDPQILTKSQKPNIYWPKTVLYEAHTKGLTMKHPLIPNDIKGTFLALKDPAIIAHLHHIGVTSLELLPIHAFVQDDFLLARGLRNYWGYNTLGFFAPELAYTQSGELQEIAEVVDALHEANIEVVLDVVYNHTCEGNHLGPTLSWKGIDSLAYYRSLPGAPRYFDNLTGCGNAVNTSHPKVLQMVLDSLRLWATVYGIDGFRFDLALTLGRTETGFSKNHPFFYAILQDPVLSQCKLIAEPWDVGPGGYQLGEFPAGFSEWNGAFRDNVRDFWTGKEGILPEFSRSLSASSQLFSVKRRRPWASVNFVTAHDGFTLHDLVSYNEKHNTANGENNQDGANDNRSWNCGVEGETDDAEIKQLRLQQKKNLLATLLLSQGVPMILGGDELNNSQSGNNNAYCHDDTLSWIDWDSADKDLIEFMATLTKLRKSTSALSRAEFLTGNKNETGVRDVSWFNINGLLLEDKDWQDPFNKAMVVKFAPADPKEVSVLILINSSHIIVNVTIPSVLRSRMKLVADTTGENSVKLINIGDHLDLAPTSMMIFKSDFSDS